MATFNNGESGSSVRTKINAVLQHTDGTAGELVINEAGADVDFRVESDTNVNALFVDGASGNVGIGTSSPARRLNVSHSGTDGTQVQINGTTDSAGIKFVPVSGDEWEVQANVSNQWFLYNRTDNAFRLMIDGSGNLGLGVTPSAWTSGFTALEMSGVGAGLYSTSSADMNLVSNAYNSSGWKYGATAPAAWFQATSGSFKWNIAPSGTAGAAITFTQAMTLDASGDLLVGTTTSLGAGGLTIRPNISQGAAQAVWNRPPTTNTSFPLEFQNGNVTSGFISYTNTATAYNTSSDYRLKEDVQPIAAASSRLAALNPVNFAWKADGTRTDGFIAHEVQAVVPQAVTGEKDGEAMQAIDHSKLVPLLTAALQEALAMIASLKARLDAANL